MEKMTIKEFASKVGVVPDTVRKWEYRGKITPSRTSGGHRRYTEEDILTVLRNEDTREGKRNVIYCRVSDHGQEDDLIRQVKEMKMFALGRRLEAEIITEIGDGKDLSRPKLKDLVTGIVNREVATVIVEHEHRLLHTGFELLHNIANTCGCEIIAVSNEA